MSASICHQWTLWWSSFSHEPKLEQLKRFISAEQALQVLHQDHPIHQLPEKSYLHLFRPGIRPLWEDPSNASGGHIKLVATNNAALRVVWLTLAAEFTKDAFPSPFTINGVSVMSRNQRVIKLWLGVNRTATTQAIRQHLLHLLDAKDYKSSVVYVEHKSVLKGAFRQPSTAPYPSPLISRMLSQGSIRTMQDGVSSPASSPCYSDTSSLASSNAISDTADQSSLDEEHPDDVPFPLMLPPFLKPRTSHQHYVHNPYAFSGPTFFTRTP